MREMKESFVNEMSKLIDRVYELGFEDGKKNKDKDTHEIKIGSVVENGDDEGVITYIERLYREKDDSFDVLWNDGFCSVESRDWVEKHINGEVIDVEEALKSVFRIRKVE